VGGKDHGGPHPRRSIRARGGEPRGRESDRRHPRSSIVGPGETSVKRSPEARYSATKVSWRPRPPNLAAAYAALPGNPRGRPTDPTVTMSPPLPARISGTKDLATSHGPRRLAATWASKSAVEVSSNAPGEMRPRLFDQDVGRSPFPLHEVGGHLDLRRVGHVAADVERLPGALPLERTRQADHRAPSRASRSAVAAPMPREAPVTPPLSRGARSRRLGPGPVGEPKEFGGGSWGRW